MHILIIPFEECIPEHHPLSGIFQYQQALALKKRGFKVGIISIELKYSLPMLIKGMLKKIVKIKINNKLQYYSFRKIFSIFINKVFFPFRFIKIETNNNIKIYRIEGHYILPPSPKSESYSWCLAGKRAFKKYLSENGKPEIIHAHNAYNAGLLANKLSKTYKIPYIITENSSWYFRNLVPNSLYPAIIKAFAYSRKNIMVSNQLGTFIESLHLIKCSQWVYIPNILYSNFEKLEDNTNRISDKFRFLHIAELVPVKAQENLLKAFALKFKQKHKVELRIGGDGTLREKLIKLCDELSISDKVIFLGRLTKTEVVTEMLTCDTFILSSQFETFGVVLIEAMACGKPVIATRCGGPESIVNLTNGILVEPNNIEKLANAMVYMTTNYTNYNAKNIRQEALEKYSEETVIKQIVEVYKSIIN